MRITQSFAVAALVAVLAPVPAFAQDFDIIVPVQFSKLPSNVKTMTLKCQVIAPASVRTLEEIIGTGTFGPSPAPADGTLQGAIGVSVIADPGKDRTKANKYHCWIWFTAVDLTSRANVDYFRPDDPTGMKQFPTTAGAPLVLSVTGVIPP
jgi:hypothetical protein